VVVRRRATLNPYATGCGRRYYSNRRRRQVFVETLLQRDLRLESRSWEYHGLSNSVPNAAFKFTMPQIIKQLGFTSSTAQLLTIPPYFCGGVAAWVTGRLADRFKWRFPFIAEPLVLLTVSLAVLLSPATRVRENVGALYFSIILAQIGTYPLLPCISAWTGNNLAHYGSDRSD
jgi:MFS family permease